MNCWLLLLAENPQLHEQMINIQLRIAGFQVNPTEGTVKTPYDNDDEARDIL